MILVTGGSGFLGSKLVQRLSAQGQKVRALYHSRAPRAEQLAANVEWMRCDLLDVYDVADALEGVEDVYHCAAIVSFDANMRDRMLHFNPESTANLVNECIDRGIRKLVHVSSIAALGRNGAATKEINEEQEWGESKYNSAYGLSKYLAENEVWRGVGEGLNAVIVNPSVILGAGDWEQGSAQLIQLAAKEFKYYTGGINGWVDAEDVVTVMIRLMASNIEAERYVVSAGNYEYRKIFELLAKGLGKRGPTTYAGPLLTGIMWRASALYSMITGKKALITKETAQTAQNKCYYNNQKLLQALQDFNYTPIEVTSQRMAEAYMKGKTNV